MSLISAVGGGVAVGGPWGGVAVGSPWRLLDSQPHYACPRAPGSLRNPVSKKVERD